MTRPFFFGSLILTTACGAGGAAEVVRSEAPGAGQVMGEEAAPTCDGKPSYGEPLVVDLPSQARLDLELAIKEGVPVVRYGCEGLKVLKRCKLDGDFAYAGVSLKEELVELENKDELRANLPFSGAKLAAGLDRGSSVHLALALVGRRTALLDSASPSDLRGSCEGATHFVRAATVGAFALRRGSRAEIKSAAELFGAGSEAGSSSEKSSAVKDGSLEACRQAGPDSAEAPAQCRSTIRLELIPLEAGGAEKNDAAAGVPAPVADPCPEGFALSGAKCVRRDADVARLCAPTDRAECKAQCEKGSAGSCYHLARLIQGDGTFVSGDDTLAAQAAPLFDKACEGDRAEACFYVAARHERGVLGAKKNLQKAAEFLQKACDGGHALSCGELGTRFERGEDGWKADKPRALSLYQRSCDLGMSFFCFRAVRMHLQGEGTPKSPEKARALLTRTCEGGDAKRCGELGVLLLEGRLGPKDSAAAERYLDKGCAMGREEACFSLAKHYAEGKELKKDLAKARGYWSKACDGDRAEKKPCKELSALLK